jgi:hypothetical protein
MYLHPEQQQRKNHLPTKKKIKYFFLSRKQIANRKGKKREEGKKRETK